MSKKLEGKVAVITGGNRGIGLATARQFVAEGAHVFITGRRQAELEEAVRHIGKHVTAVQGDVSRLADLDRLFATVERQQGRLDVLFANAGVGAVAPLGSITEGQLDTVFTINVKGLVFTAQKALPLLTDGGSIILNASIAASKGLEAVSVYGASKAAVRSLARCWANELRHRQVRVNVLSPGPIETPLFTKGGLTREQIEAFKGGLVYWSEALGHWVLTRYDDVLAGARNPALSSARVEVFVRAQLRGSDPALASDYTRINTGMMINKDGPDHHRLRVLGNHAFTPSAPRRWQPVIERVVEDLLEAVLPRGRMDLIGDLARPLPAVVIADLFGIPPEDRETFHQWSVDGARFFGGAVGDPEQAARAANEASAQRERYFHGLLEERRRRPGNDLMSLLLQGQAEGRLSAEEVCAQCSLLLTAGHITTMDQLGNTALALLNHPEQWRRLRDDPALVGSAVEEGLRYDGTAQLGQRIAREDLTLRGRTIRKGDLVYLSLGAANRDPEVFAEPDRFDVGRSDNRHLAFGAGPHLCLGMTLARRGPEVALGRLVRRTPRLRFDEGRPVRRRADSLVFRGLESLPVRFD
jgi:cytochrome P450 PksS